jgi:tRNA (mo5U34)-methyltransferase
MSESESNVRQEVEGLEWVHTIDLGNSIVTRGIWGPPNALILQAFTDVDFTGKKVLDIGCWDGLWSFEAERRGAKEIYATDCVSQRWGRHQPTFSLAHKALNSRCKYLPDISVYDVREKLSVRDFDIVIFCGVYYHLKNPLLAFARLREVMKNGGVLIVEGAVIDNADECYARFFYRQCLHQDKSNWWIPTIPCLREWVQCSFFDVLKEYGESRRVRVRSMIKDKIQYLSGNRKPGRVIRYGLTAQAVCRVDPNYLYPDEDLKQFDLSQYSGEKMCEQTMVAQARDQITQENVDSHDLSARGSHNHSSTLRSTSRLK